MQAFHHTFINCFLNLISLNFIIIFIVIQFFIIVIVIIKKLKKAFMNFLFFTSFFGFIYF